MLILNAELDFEMNLYPVFDLKYAGAFIVST